MRQTQLDKAIAQLEAERAVLQLAIDKLKATQAGKPLRAARKPKLVAGA